MTRKDIIRIGHNKSGWSHHTSKSEPSDSLASKSLINGYDSESILKEKQIRIIFLLFFFLFDKKKTHIE